jgi:tetratricopeptide (TPR) repeat protein
MLEREKENILSGMNWAVSRQDLAIDEEKRNFSHTILQFMSSLDGFLDMRGYWNEYGISLNQAVKSANALNGGREKAVWVHNLGILAQKMGNYPEARKLYQQSLKIDQELGDKSGVSKSLHELGRLAQATGEYDEARKLYQQSLKIKQELGDKRGVSSSLHQLGTLAQDTGEYDEARKLYQQSLKIKQELGDKNGFAFSLAQLALLEEEQGNIEEAVKLTEQAKVIFEEIGSPHHAEKANNQRKKLEEKLSSN